MTWPAGPVTFRWKQCDSGGGNCSDIGGATSQTYVPAAGDVGKTLQAVADDGVTTLTSAVTAVIAAAGGGGGDAFNSRWFDPAAALNTPIPNGHPISPYSSQIISHLVPQGSNVWNQYFLGPRNAEPIAYPDGSTPLVTVQINFPGVADHSITAPIPSGIVLMPTNNENYLVVPLANGDLWTFYDITKPGQTPYPGSAFGGSGAASANSNWQAAQETLHSPGWTGLGHDLTGGDSGLMESYGAIRLFDTQNAPIGGDWGHALGWTGWFSCKAGNVNGLPLYVPPATGPGDQFTTIAGCYPDGARFQLDPSINIDTWPSMSGKPEWMKQMARTLQVYGMIAVHGATGQGDGDGFRAEYSANFPSGQRFPWQDPATGAWPDPYNPNLNLPPDLISHFRVLDWTVQIGS